MKINYKEELEALYLKAKEENNVTAMIAALDALERIDAKTLPNILPLPNVETFDPVVSAKEAPNGTPYDVGDNPRKTQDKW